MQLSYPVFFDRLLTLGELQLIDTRHRGMSGGRARDNVLQYEAEILVMCE